MSVGLDMPLHVAPATSSLVGLRPRDTTATGASQVCSSLAALSAPAGPPEPVTIEPVGDYASLRQGLAERRYALALVHPAHLSIAATFGDRAMNAITRTDLDRWVADMAKAGKEFPNQIFQIGHQRHSNPRYVNLRENIIKKGVLGRVTHCYAQWNRGVSGSQPQGEVKGYDIPQDVLTKNGYGSLEEFRNWRFFKKYGGGPLSDLGAHQIDMFNWMYESTPVSVIWTLASGYSSSTSRSAGRAGT